MSNPDPSLLEESFDNQQGKFFDKKKVFVLLLILITVAIALGFFYFSRQKSKPTGLETLDQYQLSRDFSETDSANFAFFAESGYELSCQILLKEIYYPNQVFDNFIIQAAAPCWFYNQDNQPSAVNVPIIIEDISSQRWTDIGSMEFIPTYTGPDKNQVIRGFSQYVFIAESNSPSPELFEAVVVKLNFAKQTPYQDYFQDPLAAEGEYIPKPEFYRERFLLQLANQHQNKDAIDYFLKHQHWDQSLDDYLFYHHSQRKLGQ